MGWIDELEDASFRGVPFQVERGRTRGGQRLANHIYPKRNRNYAEDMGRRHRVYSVEAYVIGDDAFAQRDKLLVALDAGGGGTLIHPTFGSLWLKVDDWSESEDLIKEHRICRFSISFMESGDRATPTVTKDTSKQAGIAADNAMASNQTSFAGSFVA